MVKKGNGSEPGNEVLSQQLPVIVRAIVVVLKSILLISLVPRKPVSLSPESLVWLMAVVVTVGGSPEPW